MIALGILTAWLTLTAAGFAGLSALRRADAREDADAGLMGPALADVHMSIPKVLSR
ncbi:MAG TPA: hypothetical protein VGH60_02305 [Solirubrobacteraceae bacterium]|jgi:hypothetical protein